MNRAQHAVHNSDVNHIHVGTLLAENDTDHKPFRSQEGKQQDHGYKCLLCMPNGKWKLVVVVHNSDTGP